MTVLPQVGAYPLTGVGGLPNVDVAYPGEVWTDQLAHGTVVPGSAVFPDGTNGVFHQKQILTADTVDDDRQVAIAARQIMIPDTNMGSLYNPWLGPNEIVNLLIADEDYVRSIHTGRVHLTLVAPDAGGYAPGERIGWNPGGTRPLGKASDALAADGGTGAWDHASNAKANTIIFECREWRPYGDAGHGTTGEGVLTVRFLRSNQ